MTRGTKFALGALCLVAAAGASRPLILDLSSKTFLNTAANGPQTPATVGLAFDRMKIRSEDRILDAYLVRAPATCKARVAILIFHGVMETISEWVPAQKFLYDHCVSSLVFDYSGHGNSSRPEPSAISIRMPFWPMPHLPRTSAASGYALSVTRWAMDRCLNR